VYGKAGSIPSGLVVSDTDLSHSSVMTASTLMDVLVKTTSNKLHTFADGKQTVTPRESLV